ncbi:hypothetical protein [Rhodococcus jostii]|uniref:hypothetical protein n=1 Tax=Rhodococcus jostii TaxID=132919 RepID=UPI00363C7474
MAAASVGALILTSCATTTDEPEAFAATVTVSGEADRASADSGECTIGANHVAPHDRVVILGDSSTASAASALDVESIDQKPDGTGSCTYTAHFEDIPANQKSYNIYVNNFARQSFTSDELKAGATHRLQNAPPTDDGIGSEVQDSGGTP